MWYWRLKYKLLDLMKLWVQIHISDGIERHWDRGGREPFPDLEAIWRNMDLQEQWDPPPPPPLVIRRREGGIQGAD